MAAGIGICFLSFQLIHSIYLTTQDSKKFFWTPHNTQIHFKLSGTINQQQVSEQDLLNRFQLGHSQNWEVHSIENIKDLIKLFELQHRKDNSEILLNYSINGSPYEQWRYPN